MGDPSEVPGNLARQTARAINPAKGTRNKAETLVATPSPAVIPEKTRRGESRFPLRQMAKLRIERAIKLVTRASRWSTRERAK